MPDLSVLIPARNEEWLGRTVEDVLAHAKADTEVIVVLDGAWPVHPLQTHPRLQVIYHSHPIGQRAATNLAARVSEADYVMKLDAHCAVADGFDVALLEAARELGPDVTQIPAQKNLHVYDVVCDACGWRQYQGVKPPQCPTCQSPKIRRDVIWQPKSGSTTTSWIFDETLRFQYDKAGAARQTRDIEDVMSSLGACVFMSRARFWQLGGLDEAHGSWGQYGVEIACKSWLSGGRHVVNKRTWFAHFFRVGGIGFPYAIRGSEQDSARAYSRELWLHNRWPGQVRPLSWLVEKFLPAEWQKPDAAETLARVRAAGETFAAGVSPVDPRGSAEVSPSHAHAHAHEVPAPRSARSTAAIVYYSDNRPAADLLSGVRRQLVRAAGGTPIVAVTLGATERWGAAAYVDLPLERGYLTMARQILAGLQLAASDVVFFAEHDCLYPEGYFEHRPSSARVYAYAGHTWKVDAATGRTLYYKMEQLSGLCADRALLVDHYRRRVAHLEQHGFSRRLGFEPGKPTRHGGLDDVPRETWWNDRPIVDIRHGGNLTPSRWSKAQFRNPRYTEGWTEGGAVPGWGETAGRFYAWWQEVCR